MFGEGGVDGVRDDLRLVVEGRAMGVAEGVAPGEGGEGLAGGVLVGGEVGGGFGDEAGAEGGDGGDAADVAVVRLGEGLPWSARAALRSRIGHLLVLSGDWLAPAGV